MPFGGKRAQQVTPSDIENLIDEQVQENEVLDFKREPYRTDQEHATEKRELRKDVTSFANAGGGYLLIGMDEDDDGRATRIFHVTDAAGHEDWMWDVLMAGIEPRLSGLEIVSIPTNDGCVILLRVPESPERPHMITCGGGPPFYQRYGRSNRAMTYQEITTALKGDLVERRLVNIERRLDAIWSLLYQEEEEQ